MVVKIYCLPSFSLSFLLKSAFVRGPLVLSVALWSLILQLVFWFAWQDMKAKQKEQLEYKGQLKTVKMLTVQVHPFLRCCSCLRGSVFRISRHLAELCHLNTESLALTISMFRFGLILILFGFVAATT